MNEDMSEIVNKISSIMNNSNNKENNNSSVSGNLNISPETISAMAQMLSSKNNNNNNNESNQDTDNNNSTPNIDIETLLKFKSIFEKMNSKDDPRSKLLLALKPYLKESRKEKLDQYIQLFNISKVIDIFGLASGGDGKK